MTQKALASKLYDVICDSHDPSVLCDICKDRNCYTCDPIHQDIAGQEKCIENIRQRLMEWNKSVGKGN